MIFETHTFFTSASQATIGTAYQIKNSDPLSKMIVGISGSLTAKTIAFEGKVGSGSYVSLYSTSLITGTSASQAVATTDEIWSIPAVGLDYIRCRVGSITGSATAIGKFIIP